MSELAADKQNYVRPRDSWTQLTCPTLSAGHNGGSKSEFSISIKLFTKSSPSGGLIFVEKNTVL